MRFTLSAPSRQFRSAPGRENAQRFVEHAVVRGVFITKTEKAILLAVEGQPAKWVPFFRLDKSSLALIYRSAKDTEVSVQVQLQFALDQNFV